MEPLSLYLHIPFCQQRCAYCDFNTYAGVEALIPAYVNALCDEIAWMARSAPVRLPVHTVYFGGGTPSLLPSGSVARIVETINAHMDLLAGVEITLEANPGTVTYTSLKDYRSIGINRLSFGVQSANDRELMLLERIHTYSEVIQSVLWARQAEFDNLSLDLMFGLPSQNVQSWQHTLAQALSLKPEHLSLYALTLEHGTLLSRWVERGLISIPDDDLSADMYLQADELLEQAGYRSYEISNWAAQKPSGGSLACRHNLQYWRGKPYLGLGAGAHGYVDHVRTVNVPTPGAYIQRMSGTPALDALPYPLSPATSESAALSQADEEGEWMMMGLRLTQEGVSNTEFTRRFGHSLEQAYGARIDRLLAANLIAWVDAPATGLILTKRGRLLGNQVFLEFI